MVGLVGGVTNDSLVVLLEFLVDVGSWPRVLTNTESDSRGKIVFFEADPGIGVNGMTCSGFVVVVKTLLGFAVTNADAEVLVDSRELFSRAKAEPAAATTDEGAGEPVMVTTPGFVLSLTDEEGKLAISEVTDPLPGGTTIVSVA